MTARIALLLVLLEGLASADPTKVVILRSGDLPAYALPAKSFREDLATRLPGAVFEEHLASARPPLEGASLVFAAGEAAATYAARNTPAPVIFTSVLDWKSHPELSRPGVAGVSLEVPADTLLLQAKFLSPDLRRVVVITRSGRGGARLDELRAAGARLRLEIVPLALDDAGKLEQFANLDRIETAVHPLADPAIYTGDRFLGLVAWTRAHHLPLIAFSDRFVEAGATLAVGVNYADLGAQASLLAESILGGQETPEGIGVVSPVGTQLAVNEAAARACGVTVSDELRQMTDRMFTTVAELPPPEEGEEPAGERTEADFFAAEDEIVRVAARRRQTVSEAPSIVSVWRREDLEALGARTLADALMLLPGVTARYNRLGGWDILFRGQNQPADLLLLVDGQRINSTYDGAAVYDLPLAGVARIEVIRGPGSAIYGTNALSGVVSVVTRGHRTATEIGGAAVALGGNGGAGAFGEVHARTARTWSRWELSLSSVLAGGQGAPLRMPLDVNGAIEPRRDLDDHKQDATFFAQVTRKGLFGGAGSLTFDPKLIRRRQGPNFGPTETLATDSTLERDIYVLPLELAAPLGRRLWLYGRVSYERQSVAEDMQIRPDGFRDRANPVPAPDGLGNHTSYGVNDLAFEPRAIADLPRTALWDRHVLTLGLRAERGWIDDFSYAQNYLDASGTLQFYENFSAARRAELSAMGVPTSGFQNYNQFALAQKDAERLVLSAYAQSELRLPRLPAGEVWLTAGLRVDRFSDGNRDSYAQVNPRAALVWSPHPVVGLKLIYGRAFRAPTFQELYDTTKKISEQFFQIPNEGLRPQTVSAAEVGLELKPWRGVVLRGNAYRMTTDDNLDFDPTFNPAGVQVINFPGREAKGLELELSLRPTTRDFVTASFAQAEAEQLGDCVRREMDGSCTGDANVISRELTDFPRRRFNFAASVRPLGLWGQRGPLRELSLATVWHHVGPSRNNARVTFEQLNLPFVHPGYDRLDVGLTYPFRAWHGTLLTQVFVQDVLGADLAEPLVLTLEPRPAEGYFLPRPGRSFMLRVEWRQ